jgi:hypothetical protein
MEIMLKTEKPRSGGEGLKNGGYPFVLKLLLLTLLHSLGQFSIDRFRQIKNN